MRRGGIGTPAPRRCSMATENFTTKPSARCVSRTSLRVLDGRRRRRSGSSCSPAQNIAKAPRDPVAELEVFTIA
ncbi:hypothetical protein GQ607_013157 [Colletotrichum asianum]|uniref:Uncharacterized protein n=1 Tax=Colletotrichum asianum TaxID=702518 RepID=A0A8H3W5K0_9PEZI|nr:hypothetical protein GQ607_013157 [Colletotrichum asianum]